MTWSIESVLGIKRDGRFMVVSARKVLVGSSDVSLTEECRFFQTLKTGEGVWKTTATRRMDDVNAVFAAVFQGPRAPEIMDVGASSGITTVEWREDLLARGMKPSFLATDLMIDGHITRVAPSHYVLTDAAGRVLQHEIDGQVLAPTDFEDGAAPVTGPGGLVASLARSYYRLGGRFGWHRVPVRLVSPRATEIAFAADDIFSPTPPEFCRRFDVLRAANILNHCYFPPERLAAAVVQLKARLKGTGAMMIVNRTRPDDTNHATFFTLDATSRFRVTGRVGDGSEIEECVLSAKDLSR